MCLCLTTTIPSCGGSGSTLHLAGSHLGMVAQVPLLQVTALPPPEAEEALPEAASSKSSSQVMLTDSPWRTVAPVLMLAARPFSMLGTMHGARQCGTEWDHLPSACKKGYRGS